MCQLKRVNLFKIQMHSTKVPYVKRPWSLSKAFSNSMLTCWDIPFNTFHVTWVTGDPQYQPRAKLSSKGLVHPPTRYWNRTKEKEIESMKNLTHHQFPYNWMLQAGPATGRVQRALGIIGHNFYSTNLRINISNKFLFDWISTKNFE